MMDDHPCCDLHGRYCEPPSELCCHQCVEAVHQLGDSIRGYHLADRSPCSVPDVCLAVLSHKHGQSRCTVPAGQSHAEHLAVCLVCLETDEDSDLRWTTS